MCLIIYVICFVDFELWFDRELFEFDFDLRVVDDFDVKGGGS